MWAYIVRRLLWMVPTILGILLINFSVLRLRDPDPSANNQQMDEMEGRDAKQTGSQYENVLGSLWRTGSHLPALMNFRGYFSKEELTEWLWDAEGSPDKKASYILRRQKELWRQGRFAAEPLYQILNDPTLKEIHAPASMALSLCTYIPLDKSMRDSLGEAQYTHVRNRNKKLRNLRLEYDNSLDDGYSSPDEAQYEKTMAAIQGFWLQHGEEFRFSTGDRLVSMLIETGFVDFNTKLITGNLYSEKRQEYVFTLIGERWMTTFWFNISAIILAWMISIPMGIRSARIKGSFEDKATTNVLFFLWSVPEFFIASLLLAHFCVDSDVGIRLFPNKGLPDEAESMWMSTPRYLVNVFYHGVLPLLVLVYGSFTTLSRYMRGQMLDQLESDYIRTARAKGANEDRVVYGHALRNSMLTMITLGSGLLASMFGGVLIVELVFSINGLGRLMLDAAISRDIPLVMGSTVVSVILLLVGILVADILYAVVDPRIRSRFV